VLFTFVLEILLQNFRYDYQCAIKYLPAMRLKMTYLYSLCLCSIYIVLK